MKLKRRRLPERIHYLCERIIECHDLKKASRLGLVDSLLDDAGTAANHLILIQAEVDRQAEDEALWSVPAEKLQSISEAYLQQELRKLHAVVESL